MKNITRMQVASLAMLVTAKVLNVACAVLIALAFAGVAPSSAAGWLICVSLALLASAGVTAVLGEPELPDQDHGVAANPAKDVGQG